MRYLQTQAGAKAGGCVFIAGWFKLENLVGPQEELLAKPWLDDPVDYKAILNTTGNFKVLLSDNDDYGAVAINKKMFEEKLKADVEVMHNMGHFTAGDGVVKLPEALEGLLGFSSHNN